MPQGVRRNDVCCPAPVKWMTISRGALAAGITVGPWRAMGYRNLDCSWCGGVLNKPFSCRVIRNDGTQSEVRNRIPVGIEDGNGAVLVYLHKNCKKQCKTKRPRPRTIEQMEEQERKRVGALKSIPVYAKMICPELKDVGFRMKRLDGRILMLLPGPAVRKVH